VLKPTDNGGTAWFPKKETIRTRIKRHLIAELFVVMPLWATVKVLKTLLVTTPNPTSVYVLFVPEAKSFS